MNSDPVYKIGGCLNRPSNEICNSGQQKKHDGNKSKTKENMCAHE